MEESESTEESYADSVSEQQVILHLLERFQETPDLLHFLLAAYAVLPLPDLYQVNLTSRLYLMLLEMNQPLLTEYCQAITAYLVMLRPCEPEKQMFA